MTLAATISVMAGVSLASMAASKIATECGNANIAQYINLFASSSIGLTALTAGVTLVRVIAGI